MSSRPIMLIIRDWKTSRVMHQIDNYTDVLPKKDDYVYIPNEGARKIQVVEFTFGPVGLDCVEILL